MKIKTTRFGELNIPEEDIVTFPEGLLGFAEHKRYVLLDSEELDPLKWLQCVDAGYLAFVVLDPRIAIDEYDMHVSRECAQGLRIESPEDAMIFAIITADDDPAKCTINLQAPIIINRKNYLARQIILLDQQYSIHHPLLSDDFPTSATSGDNAVP